jgi:hypothetical protein
MSKSRVEPIVNDWMSRIKAGIEYRKRFSTRQKWNEYRDMYRGKWNPSLVPVNKVFALGRALVPRAYFKAPRIVVTATRPDMVWHARVVEAIDNALVKQAHLKLAIKQAIIDAYLCGVGPIKLGFDSEFGYLPEQSVTESGETVTQVSRTERGETLEYNQGVRPGMPWALRVRPEDVIVPWGASDPHSLPWIAHYVLRPLEDVQQDQKYDRKATAELKGTRMPSMEDVRRTPFRPREERDKDIPLAELYEIRDAKRKQVLTICENKLLLAADDSLQTIGLPWEFIIFNTDPEFFWAIPDVSIIEDQQKELNQTRTQASRHRAVALLKFLYLRGKLKPEELEKFLSSEVGPAVAIDDTENIGSAVMELQPHVPIDFQRESLAILNDMREGLGFSSNQLGEFTPRSGKSATEAMLVQQGFEARNDERRDIVADVICSIVRKWNSFIFKFWSSSRVTQIVGPEGSTHWVAYTGDQIAGEYDLSVDVESGIPITSGLRYQMGKDLFGALNGDQLINQMLLRQILLEAYAPVDPRVEQLLTGPPEPGMAQAIAKERQPQPIIDRGGKGSAGGRAGSSPEHPMEFQQMIRRFRGGM